MLDAAPSAAAPADALPAPSPIGGRIEAPPGGAIVRLAVTPAADAALTVDDAGEVRLWPSLDGTQPPVAVELPAASTLALQRAGRDYVALLGVSDGAWLVRFDADGKRVRASELGPFDGVMALEAGFVTWRGKHLEWLDVEGQVTRASDTERRPVPPVSNVTANGSDLVIAGADGPRYLGFAFPLADAPRGRDLRHLTVAGPPNHFLVVDADLEVVRELRPWTPRGEVARTMTWLGGRDWLIDVPSGVVVWTEGAASGTVLAGLGVDSVEPESGLVLLRGRDAGARYRLARYVAAKHAVELLTFASWGEHAQEVYLVPPSRNRGALLVTTAMERDAASVEHGHARWIHDLEHPERGATTWTGERVRPIGITQSGAVLLDHAGAQWSIVVDGQAPVELPRDAVLSPDHARVLARTSELEVTERTGGGGWKVPIPGRDWSSAQWAGDERVWLVQRHGIAVLASSTGVVQRVRTAWGFELARTPHPVSTLGRPLSVELATDRDAPLVLAADGRFQGIVREVARQSGLALSWWGPVRIDRRLHRVAFLQSMEQDGKPRLAYLVEVEPGSVVAIAASMWGFPDDPRPVDGVEPVWGTIAYPDGSAPRPTEDAALAFTAKWIHGSFETLVFTLERGAFVAVSDQWVERENTGSDVPGKRYATTSDFKRWPAGRRPKLATSHSRTARLAVSAPSKDPAALAAKILDRMKD